MTDLVIWEHGADCTTWAATCRGSALTVTRLALDRWQANVRLPKGSGRDLDRNSPVVRTRGAAQDWAVRTAQARGRS